jgi:Domain of unknown function (DUF1772)
MRFLLPALHFVNVFAAAIVGGGQFVILMVIVPVKRVLPPRLAVQIHLAMLGHQIDRFMKPCALTSAIFAIALLFLSPQLKPSTVAPLVIGLLGTAGVVITSRYFNVRTNREMEGWSLDALPADYEKRRNQWDRVHAIRTSCGLTAFAAYLVSALIK